MQVIDESSLSMLHPTALAGPFMHPGDRGNILVYKYGRTLLAAVSKRSSVAIIAVGSAVVQ